MRARMGWQPRWRTIVACTGLGMTVSLLTACYPGQYPLDIFREMHYQQSHRLLQADRGAVPQDAVPITGSSRTEVSFEQVRTMTSPTARSPQRLEQGQAVFNVNCAV